MIAGDVFEDVPLWGDLYLLSQWSDEQCITVLRHCRQCMHPDGCVLLIEAIAPPDGKMPTPQQGRNCSEQQHRALLQAAGLHLARVLPTGTPFSILEATPHMQGAFDFEKRGNS